ncbi:hypothetical protein RSJ42_11715 [Methanosarcina hadiensis]|uniref:hypothetical protein n=1 Tax=Methanosarcina hadiensis TaxID=3078083 RepID=UPI003977CD8E
MKQIQDSLKTDPEYTSLTRSYKVEQIQDGLKTDPVISFIYSVNCEMKQIQESMKLSP